MNKTKLILAASALFLASAFTANAQYQMDNSSSRYDGFGAEEGDWELTLGGSGTTNKDFDNSLGGVDASLGYFLTDMLEVSVRQSVSYSNDSSSNAEFDGSTFVAFDYHFGTDNVRPFIGVNAGGLYGENTSDTWAAGVEGGVKFYVQEKTFIFAIVNYAWTFDDSDGVTDNFDDGAVIWSLGVGFNF